MIQQLQPAIIDNNKQKLVQLSILPFFLSLEYLPVNVDDASDGRSEQLQQPIRPTDRMQRVNKTISHCLIHEFLLNFFSP